MRISIIGAGNLGSSLAKLLKRNLEFGNVLTLSDKRTNLKIFEEFPQIENTHAIENSDILFLCVKPNEIFDILKDIKSSKQHHLFKHHSKMIVSCAAGVSISEIEKEIGTDYTIVRCMTNIPISTGQGCITYCSNKKIISKNFFPLIKGPLIQEVKNEKLIDLSTVLTGCMPAFTAFLAEEFINFGIINGLSYSESRNMYIATIQGTMELLKKETTGEIIKEVSSPNGVTAKGIEYLKQSDILSILSLTLNRSLDSISNLTKNKN